MEKRYEHQSAEKSLKLMWLERKLYAADKHIGPRYTIDTPPPTVSGNLHIGHIFSYTQTDIIARYKRMSGFSVFYPFGFDDNGLPTERYVEKKLKVSAHQFSRSEFIQLCLKETHEAEEEFKSLWQSMGLSVDWDYCYSTISDSTRKISQESFLRLLKDGFVYRKNEPALYCTTCATSVAQAELDDVDKSSFFNDIVFKDLHGNDLIIGTTRPELLPSCVALVYHPADERYQRLKDTKAIVPLFEYEVPILVDEKVDPEKGTGLVMICTFGDKTDIEWFKKFNLPYKQSINEYGKFTEQTGFLSGLKVPEARKAVLQALQEKNLVLGQKEITHAVNTHERCKKEIEYLMLPQWFLQILEHKKLFLEMADQIRWYPTHMKSRYINWVENIGWDWCLSRQRFYGIPFPVWHCLGCNEILVPSYDQLPIDPQETPWPGKSCTGCGGTNIVPDTDVMDTWNTSSVTPYICASLVQGSDVEPFGDKAKSFIPMSMRPQAHDIIRTWAFYTIVKSWMHQRQVPWDSIVISGHVLADSREKLSKSKEHSAQSPQQLLEKYSADVVRYWTASGGLGQDIAFSENQFKIGQRLVTKLWNAFWFVHEHIKQKPTVPTEFGAVNEWLLHEISITFDKYQTYFESNEFGLALDVAEKFFWNNFCDNYLELIKDQLFHPEQYDPQLVQATYWTLYHVGLRILQLYAPYLPYVTDALYKEVYETHEKLESVHLTKFAGIQTEYAFKESAGLMESILSIISQVRRLKTEQQLSLKVPLEKLSISANPAIAADLKNHEQLIRGITQAQLIEYVQKGELKLEQQDQLWFATVTLEAL